MIAPLALRGFIQQKLSELSLEASNKVTLGTVSGLRFSDAAKHISYHLRSWFASPSRPRAYPLNPQSDRGQRLGDGHEYHLMCSGLRRGSGHYAFPVFIRHLFELLWEAKILISMGETIMFNGITVTPSMVQYALNMASLAYSYLVSPSSVASFLPLLVHNQKEVLGHDLDR